MGAEERSAREGKLKIVPGVFERFERLEWETAKGYVSHDVYMIVSPRVREEARKFFNCPDLEGAELESQGGGGSAFAHWEKRIFEKTELRITDDNLATFCVVCISFVENSMHHLNEYMKRKKQESCRDLLFL
ncbi:hypothetical protein ANCDUO_03690 [Ancylostoma duodenale]|uniref:Leishmanolysin-like peptidase n=1 Tax=Ancylostoma duodenale TaxID=51022 RepID=A0A0C2D8E4_9BILA|nr:hypothetical protein ANCDUO_03690 [Ancylostoma duodenale]